jgi:hypothetical protein
MIILKAPLNDSSRTDSSSTDICDEAGETSVYLGKMSSIQQLFNQMRQLSEAAPNTQVPVCMPIDFH